MRNIWIWVVVVVVVIGGGFLWWQSTQAPAVFDPSVNVPVDTGASSPATNPADTSAPSGSTAAGTDPTSATVTYSGTSFTPASVTIKQGGTVTFVDSGGRGMWVASNPHPVHTGYDGTSRDQHCVAGYSGAAPFDQCSTGSSFSFTFTKVGSWGYHDHDNMSAGGTVVVVQ